MHPRAPPVPCSVRTTKATVLTVGVAREHATRHAHHNFQDENLSPALLTVARLMGSNLEALGLDDCRVSAELPGVAV